MKTLKPSLCLATSASESVSAATLAYYRGIAAQASAKATLDCVTAFARTDLRNDLAAMTVPTLIIHGDSDAVFPYEASGARAYVNKEQLAADTLRRLWEAGGDPDFAVR